MLCGQILFPELPWCAVGRSGRQCGWSGSAASNPLITLDRPGLQRSPAPVRTKLIRVRSKSDRQARPVYHRKRDSIEAHLTIVFAALAISRWIEAQAGWPVRRFIKTARRYRTIQLQTGRQTIAAADPLPDDLRQALENHRDCNLNLTGPNHHQQRPRGALV